MKVTKNILLSVEYEKELRVIVEAEVDESSVFITSIKIDGESDANDLIDFISNIAKDRIKLAYKTACFKCGVPMQDAEVLASTYSKGLRTIYESLETRFSTIIKDELQKGKYEITGQ